MRGHNGFTLLEVLIAMVILAIGLLGLLSMMITAMDANAYSEDYITAHHLIIGQAELLKRRGYSRLIDGTYHDTYTAPKTGLSFRKKWVITQDSVFPYLLRNITVSVTWRRATRDAVQHKIETTFSVGRGT